jgi:ankyrin repeat protein
MEPVDALQQAITANDAAGVARVLEEHPGLKAQIDKAFPGGSFGQTALLAAVQLANREMVDALLRAGANINQKSHWWAGGFHVLDDAWRTPWMAPYLMGRGAVPEIHHAVRLGMIEDVRRMLSEDPGVVHARGGDGQTPLHFAQTVEMAEFLLERGADINARDVDHESTAAQWMVRDRPEVARALMKRGCATDILMASALGDLEVVTRILDADPGAIRTAVTSAWFPMQDSRAGGSIYIWTLGANKTAPVIAREFGHEEVFRALMDRAPDGMRLALACELGDEDLVERLIAAQPDLPARLTAALTPDDRRKLADAAQDENVDALRLMLKAGWPVDARGQHKATALHWAGFHGNAEMARQLVEHGAPVNVKGDDYNGTPLDWALHGSRHGWRAKTGDYAGTVEAMLAAGAEPPSVVDGARGSQAVIDVLRRHARARTSEE